MKRKPKWALVWPKENGAMLGCAKRQVHLYYYSNFKYDRLI